MHKVAQRKCQWINNRAAIDGEIREWQECNFRGEHISNDLERDIQTGADRAEIIFEIHSESYYVPNASKMQLILDNYDALGYNGFTNGHEANRGAPQGAPFLLHQALDPLLND